MLLEKARLVNVCQHRDLQADFGPGITAIVGQNGSGKSNLADMIRVCATNDFSSVRGTKDMNVRRGILSNDMSYIQTWWTTRNGYISIRRGLQNVPSALYVNNEEDKTITGKEQAITKRALELLSVSAGTINDFMFADFRTLRQIVEGTKAARMEMFTSLCGIDHIQRIDRVMQKQLAADSAVIAEAASEKEIEDMRVRWQLLKPKIKQMREAWATLLAQLVPQAELTAWREARYANVNAAETMQKLTISINTQVKSVEKLSATLHEIKCEVAKNQQACEIIRTQKLEPLQQQLAVAKEQQQTRQARLRKYKEYQEALKAAAKEAPKPPVKPADHVDYEKAVADEANIKTMLKAAKDKQTALGEGGDIICGECGTKLGEVTAQALADAAAKVLSLTGQLTAAKAKTAAATGYRQAVQDYSHAFVVWEKDVATAKQTLDRLAGDADAVSPPEDDNSEDMGKLQMEYDHVFKQMELVKNRLAAADEKLVPGTRQLTMAEANMATARQELISLKDTYGDNPQDVVESLTEKLKVQERLQAQHSDLTTLLRVEETRAGELLPQLRSGLRKRRKVTRLIKFVDLGNRFRNMAGRDRLQARAISKTLRKTTHYVNNFLRQFSMPFTVSIDPEEFEFIAHHRDGTKEAAVRLSAGQGLALGISFWLARTTAFHGELPLFVLDEPTANLDAERVVSVASLFRKLGDELQAAGRQGIVITHHMAVAEASTRKVVLQ